ncbi:zinc finger protein 425-like [Hyalella azteca]|uniref:Zinc finger protein 425-like n=1 Tax=Hyalella azteca TaxID=294128 RepID=A0A979FWC3_HYAAZ|nr:zinc finger protein 425-like [Hyalella azteca]
MEAQVQVHDAYPNSSLNIPLLFPNQFGQGGSAPASGDADGDDDVSGASSSQQHIRIGCPQHGFVSAGASDLHQNIDLEHPASGPHPCTEETSSSGSGLQQNIDLDHPVSGPHRYCEDSSSSGSGLHKNIDLEHPASGPHRCSEDSSSSGSGLQQHNNTLYSTETFFKFPEVNLQQHIKSRHPQRNARKFSLSKCAGECKEILHKCHLSKRSSVEKFCCSKCDYVFTTKGNFKRHFLSKHSTEKPFQCCMCDYAFTTRWKLKSHFLSKHSTEKPFQCSECDFVCTTKGNLKRHLLFEHSTKKPFQCSECDYACTKNTMEKADPPPALKVPAIYIKEEPEDETEECAEREIQSEINK